MELHTILDLLDRASRQDNGRGILAYPERDMLQGRNIAYSSLKQVCESKSAELRSIPEFRKGDVVLIHFTDHLDNILWFWAVLLAGCVPALSMPLPNDLDQRRLHLQHLQKLFDNPIVLTRLSLAEKLGAGVPLKIHAVETLTPKAPSSMEVQTPPPDTHPDDLAALMLTSGSTGNSKAVCLTHGQMLASVRGKATVADLSTEHAVLNWVGIDHVGALMECHLLAIYQGLEQVHAQAADLIAKPVTFLQLISRHHVGRTFAPNFFLASLVKAATRDPSALADIDLSCLKFLTTGGEANPVNTCVDVTNLLSSLGAAIPVLSPAFGMTETCAGSIYNTESPAFDMHTGMAFASLGRCVPGIEMRVMPRPEATDRLRGALQVRGPIVFKSYYKNAAATADAYTADGWFDTGDEAMIDATGYLHMTGRIKEHIRINGLAIIPADIESSLKNAEIPGAVDDYYACFGFRGEDAATESLAVLYLPRYNANDVEARASTNNAIVRAVLRHSSVCPCVLPLDAQVLQKSTLGKLSRGKLKQAFTDGKLHEYQKANDEAMHRYTTSTVSTPLTATEKQLMAVVHRSLGEELGLPEHALGVETPLLEMGVTSGHLILLKRCIESEFVIKDLPMPVLISNPTVRGVAAAVDKRLQKADAMCEAQPNANYTPVVKMSESGSKSPLWLFHPGVGEVLVFLGLSKYVHDRPVYALRARGFEEGETYFTDINNAVSTYFNAIKAVQPHGPYALAGYSYGTMLAFETAKRLDAECDGSGPQVQFLGSFNLPPHIKERMRTLDFVECALHLAYFLDMLSDAEALDLSPKLRGASCDLAVGRIFAVASPARLAELNLTVPAFARWAELAHSMQAMARDYEPRGAVSSIDAFYCHPLTAVAEHKADWLARHMSKWSDFCSGEVRFHDVDGEHYTMINKHHIASFQRVLRAALSARGL